jgi:site-specific recombinase XerD
LLSLAQAHKVTDGADVRTIQVLLGHGDLETTAKYAHLSAKHLHAVINPLESITALRRERRTPRIQA